MPGQEADEVRELLAFDPSTAGSMMNSEFVFMSAKLRRAMKCWSGCALRI